MKPVNHTLINHPSISPFSHTSQSQPSTLSINHQSHTHQSHSYALINHTVHNITTVSPPCQSHPSLTPCHSHPPITPIVHTRHPHLPITVPSIAQHNPSHLPITSNDHKARTVPIILLGTVLCTAHVLCPRHASLSAVSNMIQHSNWTLCCLICMAHNVQCNATCLYLSKHTTANLLNCAKYFANLILCNTTLLTVVGRAQLRKFSRMF